MMIDSCLLTNLSLFQDTNDTSYYLCATIRVENDKGIYELTIPKILLPINLKNAVIESEWDQLLFNRGIRRTIDLGFGKLQIKGDCFIKELEKKVKKMTLLEIEKELGYKVELVSKK